MKIDQLPKQSRVKISSEDMESLWDKASELGASKTSEITGYSSSKIYSWKSKDLFLPADFVLEFVEDAEVLEVKSNGRGSSIENPNLDFSELDELLTRFNQSVYINKEGVPFYRTNEYSLLERFREILSKLGDFEVKIYRRGFYEIRFPKIVQLVLSELDYSADLGALVDESGRIADGEVLVNDSVVSVNEFDQRLYSDRLRSRLAIEKGDKDELQRIIADQASKANSLL